MLTPERAGAPPHNLSFLDWNIQRWDAGGLLAPTWRQRRPGVLRLLGDLAPDVIGLQEVLAPVIPDVRAVLPHHGWVGVGRGDGKERGEYAPILYDRRRLTLIESSWFWLAEETRLPGVGWDAWMPRIATWARFAAPDRTTLFVLNTHLDHRGIQARSRSAWLILGETLRRSRGDPFVIMGDFNAHEHETPLRTLRLVMTSGASDRRRRHLGPRATHSSGRIDHILYSRHFAPAQLRTIPARGASDHNALYYHLDLKRPAPKLVV